MAYVTGPLHSTTASGQIGKTAIYQTYNGRTYAKAYAVPGNTPGYSKMNQTPAQLAIQALTKSLMQHWKEISAEDQATWDAIAVPARWSRIIAYMKDNWRRNRINCGTTDTYPAADEIILGTMTAGENPGIQDIAGDYVATTDFDGYPAYRRAGWGTPRYLYYGYDESGYAVGPTLGSGEWVAYSTSGALEDTYEEYGEPPPIRATFALL